MERSSIANRKKALVRYYIPLTLTLIFLNGCSSIGPSTVELSQGITVRVQDLHRVHAEALNQYFDFQEKQVEDFIEREWTPLFLRNFLGLSGIISDINSASRLSSQLQDEIKITIENYLDDVTESDRIVSELSQKLTSGRSGERSSVNEVLKRFIDDEKLPEAESHVMAILGSDEPAVLIMDFSQEAHIQINLQREKMLEPIRDERKRILRSINDRYEEVLAAQGIISGRLEAASNQSQARSDLFQSILGEGSEESIRQDVLKFGGKVSDVMTQLSTVIEDAEKQDEAVSADSLVEIVKSVMNSQSNDTEM